MPVGQDEKAAVVDDQLQAAIALAKVPTDPIVTHGALEGRGGKAQQRYPFFPPGGNVPERLADLRQSSQVVVLSHEFLVALLVAGANGPDNDLTQVQGSIPCEAPQIFPVLPPGAYNAAGKLSRASYNRLRLRALGHRNEFTLGRTRPRRTASESACSPISSRTSRCSSSPGKASPRFTSASKGARRKRSRR